MAAFNLFLSFVILLMAPEICSEKLRAKSLAIAFWVKSSRSQWVDKTKYTVQIMKCKLQAENK